MTKECGGSEGLILLLPSVVPKAKQELLSLYGLQHEHQGHICVTTNPSKSDFLSKA